MAVVIRGDDFSSRTLKVAFIARGLLLAPWSSVGEETYWASIVRDYYVVAKPKEYS